MGEKLKLPLRHSPEGGYARGEETRKRILDAALSVFAEKGYDAASTRLIATRAGVNPPALQYYFENKEGVFNSCTMMLSEQNMQFLQPVLDKLQEAVQSRVDDDKCTGLLCDLLETMLKRVYTMDNSHDTHLFIAHIHLQQGPAKALRILRDNFEIPLYDAIGLVVAKLSRLPAASEEVRLRVLSVLGLLNIFFTMRPAVLAQMNWDDISPSGLSALIKVTRRHCRVLAQSWITET